MEENYSTSLLSMHVITEQARLQWIQKNQDTLRADVYQGLADTTGDVANEDIDLQNLS